MRYLFCFFALLLLNGIGAAQASERPAKAVLQALFDLSDSEIDLASVKLAIDKLVDPTVDVNKSLNEINGMLNTLNNGLAADMTPLDKALSLSAFLYEAGSWNQNKPFQYDFNDPYGQEINTKLLSTYLKTRKGNCISMPILYLILADKLGLDVTLSTAPLHVFVKFRDLVTGRYVNIEATDRGQIVPDSLYTEKSTISAQAIQNGVYLQPLSRKESVAVIAMLLVEHYERQKQWQQSIDVAQMLLAHYPRYDYAMIKIGNAYSGLLTDKLAKVRAKKAYTPEEKQYMDDLYAQNLYWFEQAEKLGWVVPSEQEDENYLKTINQRANSQKH